MEIKNRNVYVDNSGSPIPLETFPLNENAEPYIPPQRTILWPELLVASTISMAMLFVGFTIGFSACALPRLLMSMRTADMNMDYEISWVATSVPLAASIGGLLGGPLITYIGSRYTLIGTGVPFFISWILVAITSNLHLVIAGRVLSGICVGVIHTAFSIYIVETGQPKLRGALGLLPIAFRNGGIFLMHLACPYLDISTMAYIAAALSVPIFLLFFVTPESPRWYIAKGQDHNARKALQWLRGKNYNIENEMQDLTQFQIEANKTKGIALKQMFYMENTPAILISFGLMIFQQLTGSNIVMFYCIHYIMTDNIYIETLTIKIEILVAFSVIIAIILVDIIGRKMLLYISSGSIIVSFLILGVFAYIQQSNDKISVGSLAQVSLTLHVFGSMLGFESIPWLMLGEILPLKIRGTVASLVTGITWLCTYYMASSPKILTSHTLYSIFFSFAVIHVVAILFVRLCVPETRGKSLEEIEINLTQRVKILNNSCD